MNDGGPHHGGIGPDGWAPPTPLPPAPPPGQQPWGAPPPGQQPWGVPPPGFLPNAPPPEQPHTNGFAITSLVLGILGVVVPSIIFGILALRHIPRRGHGGKGLAIGGLLASGVWIVVIGAAVMFYLSITAQRDASGQIVEAGDLSTQELQIGDCINELQTTDAAVTVPGVPCTEPHEGQVYDVFEVSGIRFPGNEKIFELAEEDCFDTLDDDFPELWSDQSVEVFYFYPTPDSWRQGDQGITCVARYRDGRRTGSVLD